MRKMRQQQAQLAEGAARTMQRQENRHEKGAHYPKWIYTKQKREEPEDLRQGLSSGPLLRRIANHPKSQMAMETLLSKLLTQRHSK